MVAPPFPFPDDGRVSCASQTVRRAIHEAHGRRDFWTRAPLPFDAMSLDHVWPRAKGGPDHAFNLVPTELPLNLAKQDKLDEVAATAVLAIVRTHFGPKSLALIARYRRESRRLISPYELWLGQNADLVAAELERVEPPNPWQYLSNYFREVNGDLAIISNDRRYDSWSGPFPNQYDVAEMAERVGIRVPVGETGVPPDGR
jgi:hypothetical protein